ncbi:MAG: hypothetical protein U1E65_21755 [Myxococcota bacterium]
MSDEVGQQIRERTIEFLELLADAAAQRKYQAAAPDVNIGNEIFNQWDDWYPLDKSTQQEFSAQELLALQQFDSELGLAASQSPPTIGDLDDFMRTEPWMRLNRAAQRTLAAFAEANRAT